MPTPSAQRPPRTFCVGMNKTGTMSLARAFELLGLRVWHDAAGAARLMEQAAARGLPVLSGFDHCDCYADKPFVFWYRQLDADYPGSRFILNTRDNDAWIASRIAHTERWNSRQRRPEEPVREIDPPRELALKDRLEAEIKAHFAASPERFMVFDVCAGDGWSRLCPFLGLPVPTDAGGAPLPFPFRNRAPRGDDHQQS